MDIILNHYVLYLKQIQYCMFIILQLKKQKLKKIKVKKKRLGAYNGKSTGLEWILPRWGIPPSLIVKSIVLHLPE